MFPCAVLIAGGAIGRCGPQPQCAQVERRTLPFSTCRNLQFPSEGPSIRALSLLWKLSAMLLLICGLREKSEGHVSKVAVITFQVISWTRRTYGSRTSSPWILALRIRYTIDFPASLRNQGSPRRHGYGNPLSYSFFVLLVCLRLSLSLSLTLSLTVSSSRRCCTRLEEEVRPKHEHKVCQKTDKAKGTVSHKVISPRSSCKVKTRRDRTRFQAPRQGSCPFYVTHFLSVSSRPWYGTACRIAFPSDF